MDKKRTNSVTVDLLTYKEPWLAWCKSQNTTPSAALRQIVARLTAATPADQAPPNPAPGQPEKPTARKEIALTPSELARVEAIAEREGFSVTKWIVALIRARLSNTPQFGRDELELLGESNLRLLAIGRNLNQIARALNTNPHDRSVYRVEMVEELSAAIKAHVQIASGAIAANTQRWAIP